MNNGILIEEFVPLDTPPSGALPHALCKANFMAEPVTRSGSPALESRPFGTRCSRRAARFALRKIPPGAFVNLDALRRIDRPTVIDVDTVVGFDAIAAAMAVLDRSAGICTVDFVLDGGRRAHYLEINKQSATFAEIYDRDGPTAIDASADVHTIPRLKARIERGLADFEADLRTCFDRGFLTNVVSCGPDGIALVHP
jgi:hypothetical protein